MIGLCCGFMAGFGPRNTFASPEYLVGNDQFGRGEGFFAFILFLQALNLSLK